MSDDSKQPTESTGGGAGRKSKPQYACGLDLDTLYADATPAFRQRLDGELAVRGIDSPAAVRVAGVGELQRCLFAAVQRDAYDLKALAEQTKEN